MKEYKVVPFNARVTSIYANGSAAEQLQSLINEYAAQGWEYVGLDKMETVIPPESGCFGFNSRPGFRNIHTVAVFRR
ncbi:MAG: DUF4177 domain-containing protein [Flavobacteriales bacterium]|nr:DUF4177 domain-containing protein [Flavobacteriales bacterium]